MTYRDIGITLRITSIFPDIDRIVAEALGEVPPSDDAPPAQTPPPGQTDAPRARQDGAVSPSQQVGPPPAAVVPSLQSLMPSPLKAHARARPTTRRARGGSGR